MNGTLTFDEMAEALSLDYECVFFVDVADDSYSTYSFANYQGVSLGSTSNFWEDTRAILLKVIHADDRDRFLEAFDKSKILPVVDGGAPYLIKYRVVVNNVSIWYSLKVVSIRSKKKKFLICGITNINKQESEQIDLEQKASKSKTYSQIVMALASRYNVLCMVTLDTDHFILYRGVHLLDENVNGFEGEDFFNMLPKDLEKVVFEDDLKVVLGAFNKEDLLKELDGFGLYSLVFRVKSPEGPKYMNVEMLYADKNHVVISVSDIDKYVRREQELNAKASKGEVYGRIVMALADRYDALYMVDLETNHYAQYKSERVFSELSIALEGEDFFNQLQKDVPQVVFKDDVALVQAALTREVLLRELDDHNVFTLTYRLKSANGPLYVSLVAVYSDRAHVVISITNIDAQVRRELEIKEALGLAIEKSRRDDLTGIRNKNAYGEFERDMNEQISMGEAPQFAIAICDVNGLKLVNDTQGHKAGDEYIKTASRLVCETFKRSPVFRVGGDEFVAVLQGIDYDKREELEKELAEVIKHNAEVGEIVMACGVAAYDSTQDKTVASVFERADALMYKNKIALKGGRDEIINTIIRTIGARTMV